MFVPPVSRALLSWVAFVRLAFRFSAVGSCSEKTRRHCPATVMPRVKGNEATCSAFLEEPRCKGCLSKRPCHRKPANRRTDCTCGYCQSSIIQVAEDKEEGQLAQDSNHRCCRSQKKSNETQTPLFTTEKMLEYQTEAAKAEARKRKRREQAKYQNRKALKKCEGTRPTFNSVFLFLFLNLFIWVVLVFIRI